ncbi:helix-turn-helix transcriptional regulator [Rhodobacteraceae bacterium M382]|nr:helix-turn-helix transcriptional regulator [Rhodobacteraceae bacterium M382]
MTDSALSMIHALSLPQLAPEGPWQLDLAHDRPDHLLIWITRGQGRLLLDGAQHGFGPSTAMFIPARSLFALDAGRQALGHVLRISPQANQIWPESAQVLRSLSAQTLAELSNLHDTIVREQDHQPPFWAQTVQAQSVLAAIWLRRLMPQTTRVPASRRLIRTYGQTISQQYASGASMTDYAAMLDVTPSHLTRVCRSQTGRTAAALLNERIAHEARSQLIQTSASAKAISHNLGFASASSFNRFVQNQFGMTPGTLRKR